MEKNVLKIEAAGTLSNTAGPETSTRAVGSASVEGSALALHQNVVLINWQILYSPMKAMSYFSASLAKQGK